MKIRKFTFLPSSILFLIFMLLTVTGWAQFDDGEGGPVPITASVLKLCDSSFQGADDVQDFPCGPQAVSTTLDLNCTSATIPLAVFCANMEQYFQGDPVYLQSYKWPSHLDPVHIRYSYDNITFFVTDAIVSWRYVMQYFPNPNPYEYGSSTIFRGDSPISSRSLFPLDCSDNDEIYPEIISIQLVTQAPNGPDGAWLDYPIGNYSNPDGLFSCEVFEDTEANCNNSQPDESLTHQVADLKLCIDCESCTLVESAGYDTKSKGNPLTGSENKLMVSPNPFSNNIQYKYISSTEAPILVNLFSSNGQLILQENKIAGTGENSFILQTDQLVQGVYFLQITNGDQTTIQRLLKIQ